MRRFFKLGLCGPMEHYMRDVGEFIRISNVRNLMWLVGGPPCITEGQWPNEPHLITKHLLTLFGPMVDGSIPYFHGG